MANKVKRVEAVAYIRTSSAANRLDRTATSGSARPLRASQAGRVRPGGRVQRRGCVGRDPIDTPWLRLLLDRIEGNARTVIVEDASRFARELVTQELGILALIKRGVRVLTANGDDLTDSSDPRAR